MKKEDLKNGMIIECRNGNRYVVLNNVVVRETNWFSMNSITNDLKDKYGKNEYVIVKVYESYSATGLDNIFEDENLKLIWERETKIELKMHVMNAINNYTQWSGDFHFDGAYLKDGVVMICFKESDLIDAPLKDYLKDCVESLLDRMAYHCTEWKNNNVERWNEYEYYLLPVLRVLDEIENGVKLYN